MANLAVLTGHVREKIGSPPDSAVGSHFIHNRINEVLDELVTELNLVSAGWFGSRFRLNVSANRDIYPVTAGDYGRPLLCFTLKDNQPSYGTAIVDVVDEPELIMYQHGGDLGPAIEHSAQAIAPIYKDGQPYLRIGPIPQISASYMVVYEPNQVRPDDLATTAFRLPQFDGYLTDRAAFKTLPYAKLDPAIYKMIQETLVAEITRGDLRFRRYRRSSHQTNRTKTIPFGGSRWNRRFP